MKVFPITGIFISLNSICRPHHLTENRFLKPEEYSKLKVSKTSAKFAQKSINLDAIRDRKTRQFGDLE